MAKVFIEIDGLTNEQADDVEVVVQAFLRRKYPDNVIKVNVQDIEYDEDED